MSTCGCRCHCIPESRSSTSTTETQGNIASSAADGVPCAALGTDNGKNDEDMECREDGDNGGGDKRYSAVDSSPAAGASVDAGQILPANDTEGKASAAAGVDGAVACECDGTDCDGEDGPDYDGYSETDEVCCSETDDDYCSDGWDELYSAGNWSPDADAAGDMQIMLEGILGEFSDEEFL